MRKLALLVTLVVASAFFLGAAGAPAASAAGCTGGGLSGMAHSLRPPPAWFANYFQLTGCTGVDYVQVYATGTPGPTYINDSANFKAGPFQVDGLYSWSNPYQKGIVSGSVLVSFDYGCWFSGSQNLYGQVTYRVHQTSGAFGSMQTRFAGPTFISGC